MGYYDWFTHVYILSWEEDVADKILNMIVDLWITIRGFSLASAWVEQFKAHSFAEV